MYNDGPGIEVEVHEKEGIWVPQLIFGRLLTSSNYDDTEDRVSVSNRTLRSTSVHVCGCSSKLVRLQGDARRRRPIEQLPH